MKKITLFVLILALSVGFIKPVLAEVRPVLAQEVGNTPDLSNIQFITTVPAVATSVEAPVPTLYSENQPDLGLVVMNTASYQISAEEAKTGKKIRAFNNQFVFQTDEKTLTGPATLELKELALSPNSIMAAPQGFQFASRIYEFKLTADPSALTAEPFWFSVKYLEDDYFRKTMYFYDEQNKKWAGLEAIVSNGVSKLISKTNFTFGRVVILDDLNIMSEGTASWYKYKGCNCAASPDYPKGTKLKVTNVANGKSVIVKVNDWGPDRSVHPTRVIDLDAVAFKQIAKTSAGLCKVKVELVEPVKSATK